MLRLLTAALVAAATLGSGTAYARPAPSESSTARPTQALTLVNQAGVPAAQLRKVEAAVQVEADQLGQVWGTPSVTFTPSGGWPVYLQPMREVSTPLDCGPAAAGCHGYGTEPEAWVGVAQGHFSFTLSHEVLEMLADPSTTGVEVCDPVELHDPHRIFGVMVADFVTPRGTSYYH